jgi:hypothetical protein
VPNTIEYKFVFQQSGLDLAILGESWSSTFGFRYIADDEADPITVTLNDTLDMRIKRHDKDNLEIMNTVKWKGSRDENIIPAMKLSRVPDKN